MCEATSVIWVSFLLPKQAPAAPSVSLHGVSLLPLRALLAEPLLPLSVPVPGLSSWDTVYSKEGSIFKEGCPVQRHVAGEWVASFLADLSPEIAVGAHTVVRVHAC